MTNDCKHSHVLSNGRCYYCNDAVALNEAIPQLFKNASKSIKEAMFAEYGLSEDILCFDAKSGVFVTREEIATYGQTTNKTRSCYFCGDIADTCPHNKPDNTEGPAGGAGRGDSDGDTELPAMQEY